MTSSKLTAPLNPRPQVSSSDLRDRARAVATNSPADPEGRDDRQRCIVQHQYKVYGIDEDHGVSGALTVSRRDLRGHRLKVGPRG